MINLIKTLAFQTSFDRSVFKGNVLHFPLVHKDHRGTYYCVATNVVGVGARRNVDVEVEFSPSIKVVRKRVGQALQFDADLVRGFS